MGIQKLVIYFPNKNFKNSINKWEILIGNMVKNHYFKLYCCTFASNDEESISSQADKISPRSRFAAKNVFNNAS